MKQSLHWSVILLFAVVTISPVAQAASSRSGKVVKEDDILKVPMTVSVSGKSRSVTISCVNKSAGTTTKSGKKYFFVPYTTALRNAQIKLRAAKTKKAIKKAKDDLNLYKVLRRDGGSACIEPAHLSLREYNGNFGLKQAQRLVEVFALGGRPGLADAYTSMGLNAAVNDLTTWKPDTAVDEFRGKLTCGPNPRRTTNPDQCYRNGDINDFYLDGFVAGLNYRLINSNNPAFMALFQWVLDQRAPGNPRVLDGCSQWMFPRYIDMVDRFMKSGDYKTYTAEWVNNSFVHGKWLSGASNHTGLLKSGNEDFGREFLELFTTGIYRPDGSAVYNDNDVFQMSLAMSGLNDAREVDSSNNDLCIIGYFPDLHTAGPKRVFAGTPHEMVIDSASDAAREIYVKQREQIAYELARRLWGQFISSKGTTAAHLRLAQVILDNDFKLWPVMKVMMKSQAFYAPESNETLLKTPSSLYVSFVRMTGMPIDNYNTMMDIFGDVGMAIGKPPTVFGFSYQNKQLASNMYQLDRFNGFITHMLYQNLADIKKNYGGWTPYNGFVNGIPLSGQPGTDLVTELLKRLNLTDSFNEEQKNQLVQFVNYYLDNCYSNSDPTCFEAGGVKKRLVRDAPDLGDTEDDFYRLRAAYAMAADTPAFATQ